MRIIRFLILAGVLTSVSCQKKAAVVLPPAKVNVVSAIKSNVPVYEEFVAQVYGESDVKIISRVQGWVTDIYFKEGGRVKQGDLLYQIDDMEYRNRVARETSDLARAKTEKVRAENELNRIRPLAEKNAMSKLDLDNALAAFEAALSSEKAAQANLENAKLELSYTTIRAPFDGIIGISQVRVGDYVSRASNSVLTSLSSTGKMRVRFQISEREYLRVARLTAEQLEKTKSEVQLILADGSMYDVKGAVNFADREIDPNTGTLTVEALFDNPAGLLRPGMYVKVKVLIKTLEDVVIIPQSAVFQLQHLSQVYMLTDSATLKIATIKPGIKSGEAWVVDEGIKPGDKVAIIGSAAITPESKIEAIVKQWPETASTEKTNL